MKNVIIISIGNCEKNLIKEKRINNITNTIIYKIIKFLFEYLLTKLFKSKLIFYFLKIYFFIKIKKLNYIK